MVNHAAERYPGTEFIGSWSNCTKEILMTKVNTGSEAKDFKVVSPKEWLKARTALLAKEKEMTRLRDAISAERLALPWVRIEKDYFFDEDGWQLVNYIRKLGKDAAK